jgi:hypothetical protein
MAFKQYYTDVTPDRWYYGEIERGTFYGLLKGVGGGLYDPDRPMTRAEAGAVLTRSFEHTLYTTFLLNGIVLSALMFSRR